MRVNADGMRVALVLTLVTFATANHHLDLLTPLERDEIINAVNSAKTTWKAARNFDKSITRHFIKHLLGLKRRPEGSTLPPLVENPEDKHLEVPKTFDAREKWSSCVSLQEIRDQGPCGSCWAVAAASALTDRFCIATKTAFNGHLSAEDLLSCCCPCAVSCGKGCDGGYDDEAWSYFLHTGICTGGDYKSKEGCQPYTLPTCEHHVSGPRKNCSAYGDVPTPRCQKSCYNKKYKEPKDKDLHLVKSIFSTGGDVKKIQREIFKHGPLEAGFSVYEDFLSYKSGVYQHTSGSYLGGHAVKVIGWGTEDGTDYWLVANSWNTDWGDNGFFKIKRGTDECGFESSLNGGYPAV